MIDAQVVETLATRYQTTGLNVVREYLQHLFLSLFYRNRQADRVLFKGGTALRLIHGSPRFSEDLDFSGFGVSRSLLEELIAEALGAVEKVGVAMEIEEAKGTSGGYLAIVRSSLFGYSLQIQLEISLRGKGPVKPETALIASDFLPAYPLLHLPQEWLVEEKLSALFHRAKPRDFYDLYFILRKGILPKGLRNRLPEVLLRLKKVPPESFRELRLFLPRDQQAMMKDFPKAMERELQPFLSAKRKGRS